MRTFALMLFLPFDHFQYTVQYYVCTYSHCCETHLQTFCIYIHQTNNSLSALHYYYYYYCYYYYYFKRQGPAVLPRLEYSSVIIAHCSLQLLNSSDPPASAS